MAYKTTVWGAPPRAGVRHRHRFVVPEGCRSWCYGMIPHVRVLSVPTDSDHLDVFHTAWSKIHTFSTITPTHSFILPKAKAGRTYTCPLKSHVQLPFALSCVCYRAFMNYLSACFFLMYLAQRVAGAHWNHVWSVFSCNLVISTLFSGLIYSCLYPSIVLNQGVSIYSLSIQLYCYCSLRIFHKHQLIFTTPLWDNA